jgi:dipeptide/tripeptide permease
MKAILYVYMKEWLLFSDVAAKSIVHGFNFFAYLFTLFGGIISDSYLGKFKTILILSLVYCVGSITVAATSFPEVTGVPPHWWGAMLGLALLAFGTGGIKADLG